MYVIDDDDEEVSLHMFDIYTCKKQTYTHEHGYFLDHT